MNYLVCFGTSKQISKQLEELSSFLYLKHKDLKFTLILITNEKFSDSLYSNINDVIIIDSNPYFFNLDLLYQFFNNKDIELILFASGNYQAMYATKLAFRFNFFNANAIIDFNDQELCLERYVYANNLIQVEQYTFPAIFTIAKGYSTLYPEKTIEKVEITKEDLLNEIDYKILKTQDGYSLENAEDVIILGKGILNFKNVELTLDLSEKLNFDYGATRPVCYNGWIDLNRLVGVSGSVLKANNLLCLGVRGAAALTYSIKNVKNVIAVNTDTSAPIFQYSDVGVNMDAATFVKILNEIVSEKNGKN